jgi:hypothetical protein
MSIVSKPATDDYRKGWERAFGKKCDHIFQRENPISHNFICVKCKKTISELEVICDS